MMKMNEIVKTIRAQFEVYEDNAGGLHMFILQGGKAVCFVTDLEFHPGDITYLLQELADDASAWESWESWEESDPNDIYEEMTGHAYGTPDKPVLVANNDGIYYDNMGAAAEEEFGEE